MLKTYDVDLSPRKGVVDTYRVLAHSKGAAVKAAETIVREKFNIPPRVDLTAHYVGVREVRLHPVW